MTKPEGAGSPIWRAAALGFWLFNLAATTFLLFFVLTAGAVCGALVALRWFFFGIPDFEGEIIAGQTAWQERRIGK